MVKMYTIRYFAITVVWCGSASDSHMDFVQTYSILDAE